MVAEDLGAVPDPCDPLLGSQRPITWMSFWTRDKKVPQQRLPLANVKRTWM